MTVTDLTAITVAILPVGGHFDDVGTYVERTQVDRWRFRSRGHDVTLCRSVTEATWEIEDDHNPVGTRGSLVAAVHLAFGAL